MTEINNYQISQKLLLGHYESEKFKYLLNKNF